MADEHFKAVMHIKHKPTRGEVRNPIIFKADPDKIGRDIHLLKKHVGVAMAKAEGWKPSDCVIRVINWRRQGK